MNLLIKVIQIPKNLLNTFLEIEADNIEKLTKKDITDIINPINTNEQKNNTIKDIINRDGYKILEDIQNPYIVQPVMKKNHC